MEYPALEGREEVSEVAAFLKSVEQQVRTWELKHRLEELSRPGRWLEEGVAYGPCLLVSRECGSGGGHIARLAAERLGWQVFDREILDEIAKMAPVRRRLLETVNAQTRAHWDEHWPVELRPEDIGYEAYLRCLRQVVLALGHHGDVVLVGRGAQYLLPARCGLRVRVVAPLEARIRRLTQADGHTPEEALRYLQQFDAERAAFIRQSFQREAGNALNYDLVINTGDINLEAAAELVVLALGHKLGVRPQKR